MRIGLFGQFGTGNLGNDGSLEAMVAMLGRIRPGARLVCICPGTGSVEASYGLCALDIASPAGGRVSGLLDRLLLDAPRHLRNLVRPFTLTRGLDVIVVPGTGILDDFCETPLGWPYVLLRWCLAAWWNGVPVVFVSVGAGPVSRRLSRVFLATAARLASYRSYRDGLSRDFLAGLGIDTSRDRVNCDLVFGLPAPAAADAREPCPLCVGVGVMTYSGWTKGSASAELVYRTYLAKMRDFVAWLVGRGMRVRLLTGSAADRRAVEDLVSALDGPRDQVASERIGSLHDLMREMARSDIVVATRYHNVVCSIMTGIPTISLGYARKNDELLSRVGLAAYCNDVESFDPFELRRQFDAIVEEREALRPVMRAAVERFRGDMEDEAAALGRHLDSLEPGADRLTPLPCDQLTGGCPS